ncbi:MAG: class I SAM-dependent methyltransferase [Bacteroidales bacterium]|nr:class I SAM-dependent methyltransferase [Bacteroidales bacterium]
MSDCVFCGHKESSALYPVKDMWDNEYQLHKCDVCKTFFLNPQPSQQMLAKAYDDSYYGASDKKFNGPVEIVLDYFRRKRARQCSKLLKDNDDVLDIGCGNGNFLISLLKYGNYNLYGTELEGKSAQRAAAHNKINLNLGHLNVKHYKKESFSLITLFHVFEHLSNPRQTLENIDYLLKDKGHVVFSFPNIFSFQSRFFKGKWLHLDPPRHLFFMAPTTFISLMQYKGYYLVSQKYFSLEQNPFGLVQSILNKMLSKREVLFEHLKGNKAYTKNYSKTSIFFQKLFFALCMPLAIVMDFFASMIKRGATVELVFRKYKK